MIKVENIQVSNFRGAIRGMRNPLNSWDKSDSHPIITDVYGCDLMIGPNDFQLMKRLYMAGPEHAKYLRQIHVCMDVTAPLYLWKEIDQYKIGTTTNSCSTMHRIAAKEFTIDDFSHEHLTYEYIEDGEQYLALWAEDELRAVINKLNRARDLYLNFKDKKYWWLMIQLLPSSYNQKRTWDFDYQTAISMIKQRTGHKLDEWNEFVGILRSLPYIEELLRKDEE